MVPSKMQIPVAPFLLIPAHICTFVGCFGCGLGRGFSPSFLQQYRRLQSDCILDSLLHMTSSKLLLSLARAHSSRFCLFSFLIS